MIAVEKIRGLEGIENRIEKIEPRDEMIRSLEDRRPRLNPLWGVPGGTIQPRINKSKNGLTGRAGQVGNRNQRSEGIRLG